MTRVIYILILSALISFSGHSQKLTFKVTGIQDTTVHLVKYVGNKLYYADTANLVNSTVTFDGSKQDAGIMALLLPGQNYFEFIYNNEDIHIETKSPNYVEHMVVKKSKENQIFLEYLRNMKANRERANAIQEEINEADEEAAENAKKMINLIGEKVREYQNSIVEENEGTLVAKIIKMSTDIVIDQGPKDEEGNPIDSEYAYKYYRAHYFDNIDLSDDRLVNTPVLQNKLEYFYSGSMLLQHPDTIIKYISPILNQLEEGSMMYRFFVTNITSHFEKSKQMGMDKVTNYMVHQYYCPSDSKGNPKGYWMEEDKLEQICKDARIRTPLMIGERPPNIILPDPNDKWHNLYETKADYIILYFWDPGCGHCKKVTPQLEELYTKKLKARNVEVFSVGKATGDDFAAWKKFIADKELSFINVGVTKPLYEQASKDPHSVIPSKTTLQSINYQETYDIYSTPRVWILNKDKEIVAKSLSVAQIERYLDSVQGFEDAEKVFELEDTEAIE